MTAPDALPLLKAEMRNAALARRAAIAPAAAQAAAQAIVARGLALARRASQPAVALYLPMRGEFDCLPLLDALTHAGFATALPAIGGRGRPLAFRLWRSGEPLGQGPFGVREPLPDSPPAHPAVIFAPLAAFDRAGHRIGYGGGFYDVTLEALRAQQGHGLIVAGLAFAVQECPKIPAEPHDQQLDFVLTENETINCAGA